jgi:hypothetical protein
MAPGVSVFGLISSGFFSKATLDVDNALVDGNPTPVVIAPETGEGAFCRRYT